MKKEIKVLTASAVLAVLTGCSSTSLNKGDFKLPWDDSESKEETTVIKDEVSIETITESEVGVALEEILTEDGYSSINSINDPSKDLILSNNTIYFKFDSDKLESEYIEIIESQSKFLKENNVKVILEGHTDERGSNSYNIDLGERRAKTIKNTLLENGIQESQIEIISYGELKPISNGGTESEWSKDRRVVFTYN